jgi:hypothetical protein
LSLVPGGFAKTDYEITRTRLARAAERVREAGDLALLRWFNAERELRKDNLAQLIVLCCAAERALLRRSGFLQPPDPDDPDEAERIATNWRGWAARRVAAEFDCEERWVRAVRLERSLDPETGESTELDERTTRILALKAEGLSHRKIGEAVGLSHVSVGKVLSGR